MAGLMSKVTRFLSSPQGKQVQQQVQRAAKDPATRRKVTGVLNQLRGKGGASR